MAKRVNIIYTGSQPARGPKIKSIKTSNSVYSTWNLYIINKRMLFLTMYNKSQKQQGNTEYIMQYLPDDLGQIVAQYLTYVRSFV